ncbi:MAG: type III pantothenate kinase [Planctomycetaceae bacterium]
MRAPFALGAGFFYCHETGFSVPNKSRTNLPLLTVDVGNSRTKVAVCEEGDKALPSCVEFVPFNNSELDRIRKQIGLLATRYKLTRCVVAGSNGKLREELLGSFRSHSLEAIVLRSFEQIPVEATVDSPQSVGIDRLLNALGAKILSPTGSTILVDSGTATTVDLVVDGAFHGGAILPGLRLSAMSLHDYTDALPLIDTGQLSVEGTKVPGKNTVQAIEAGVMLGQIGSIREIVSEYQNAAPEADLVLTGGAAERLTPAFSQAEIRPYLSLRAMASLGIHK